MRGFTEAIGSGVVWNPDSDRGSTSALPRARAPAGGPTGIGAAVTAPAVARPGRPARAHTAPRAMTGLAFQVRFVMSRPFLDSYVRSVQSGPLVADRSLRPVLVGLFVVRETEALPNDVVRMITTTCGFDTCGLTYSPKGSPPVIGEDIYEPLGSGWWQWQESW
jgi:hypothetical protein